MPYRKYPNARPQPHKGLHGLFTLGAVDNIAPQTAMWQCVTVSGIPPSNHHGRAWKVVSPVMSFSSLRLVSHGFNQLLRPAMWPYFNGWDMKSLYASESEISELYFSSRCWVEIDRRCWVEMISTQHQGVIPHIENSFCIVVSENMKHDPGFTTARAVSMALGQSWSKFPSQNVKVTCSIWNGREHIVPW